MCSLHIADSGSSARTSRDLARSRRPRRTTVTRSIAAVCLPDAERDDPEAVWRNPAADVADLVLLAARSRRAAARSRPPRSLLTFGLRRPSTCTSTSPSTISAAMNATPRPGDAREAARRGYARCAMAPVEDPGTEGKVSEEVGEEDEQQPPERLQRVRAAAAAPR